MNLRDWIPVAVLCVFCAALWHLPPPPRVADDGGESYRARVVGVDSSAVTQSGMVEYGTQYLELKMLSGPGAGRIFRAENELRAQPEFDKKFTVGDTALVNWPSGGPVKGEPLTARDHWRTGYAFAAFAAFALMLAVFGGATGVKALFSFVFSCFVIWKLLVPMCLSGWNAEWTVFAVVTVLTLAIMYLIAGATRKGAVAFFGAMLGVGASLALAKIMTPGMHVTGATMPFAQTLVNTGTEPIDLASLFNGAIILASSGAVMDLAMDISAGMGEIVRHTPGISRRSLFHSGISIGRAVVGTMTTTLLLAYSGGYLTLLMVFAAQGTHPIDFLNSTLVSAELVKTLVGSFGLVLVAPFTALVGAWVFVRDAGARG